MAYVGKNMYGHLKSVERREEVIDREGRKLV